MVFFDLPKGFLLTMEEEDEIRIGNRTILLVPVWKWKF